MCVWAGLSIFLRLDNQHLLRTSLSLAADNAGVIVRLYTLNYNRHRKPMLQLNWIATHSARSYPPHSTPLAPFYLSLARSYHYKGSSSTCCARIPTWNCYKSLLHCCCFCCVCSSVALSVNHLLLATLYNNNNNSYVHSQSVLFLSDIVVHLSLYTPTTHCDFIAVL